MPTRIADMPPKSRSDNDCPRCGAEVRRVHRRTHEAQTLSGSGLRRYRCEAQGCGWQGLLARTTTRPSSRLQPSAGSTRWRLWAAAVVVMVLLGLITAGAALLALRPDFQQQDGQPVKSL